MNAHVCSACGGTGEHVTYTPSGITTGRLAGAEYTSIQRCPVCLGSGRISDVRTAADAMVDAETLRQALKVTKSGNPSCVVEGLWATARMRDGDSRGAYVAARAAARDALLRVPALGGVE